MRCFLSLFELHNETMNVWTHLIPGAIFFYLTCYHYYLSVAKGHHILPAFYTACCVVTHAASVAFHLFNCVNAGVHRVLRKLDFCCISVCILGTAWPVRRSLCLSFGMSQIFFRFVCILGCVILLN